MIQIAVCDDNKTSLKIVSESVSGIFELHGIEVKTTLFSTAKALFEGIGKNVFDLILLDIELPGVDGIKLGRTIRKNGNDCDIIFVSAREDRMYDAFEVQPFGFIRKGSFMKDAEKVITAYIEKFRSAKNRQVIMLNAVGQGSVSVPTQKIVYIEGRLKNQFVFVEGVAEPVTVNGTMKTLEAALVPFGFVRIHSGFLLNMRFLNSIGESEVMLTSGAKLPMSRRNVTNVKRAYMDYVQSHGGIVY